MSRYDFSEGTREPYIFNKTFNLNFNNVTDLAIPETGDGANIQLLARQNITYTLLPNQPFDTIYEGNVFLTHNVTAGAFVRPYIRVTHFALAGGTFHSDRAYTQFIAANTLATIPLAAFNSVTEIAMGAQRTRDRTNIDVEQRHLEGNVDIRIRMYIQLFSDRALETRIPASDSPTITVTSDLAMVNFRQLDLIVF